MNPDEILIEIRKIIERRHKSGPIITALEIKAGRAKAIYERDLALARVDILGTVAEREAHAVEATEEARDQSIIATAAFNEAKRMHADLEPNQMGLQSILKKILSDGA